MYVKIAETRDSYSFDIDQYSFTEAIILDSISKDNKVSFTEIKELRYFH